MSQGKIIKVSGPLVVADGLSDANMADVVRVGEQRLIGEILIPGKTGSLGLGAQALQSAVERAVGADIG